MWGLRQKIVYLFKKPDKEAACIHIKKITLRNGETITITSFNDGKPVPPATL
jgi:hypothetical protein